MRGSLAEGPVWEIDVYVPTDFLAYLRLREKATLAHLTKLATVPVSEATKARGKALQRNTVS